MKFYFDYIYYRVTKLYSKYPTDRGTRAIALIAMIQTASFLTVVESLLILSSNKGIMQLYLANLKWAFIFIVFGFGYFDFKKYIGQETLLEGYWKNDDKMKRRLKGICILISIILPVIAFIKVTSCLYSLSK